MLTVMKVGMFFTETKISESRYLGVRDAGGAGGTLEKSELTSKQKDKVREALGDGSDFPKMTKDPRVNHFVDLLVADALPWEALFEEERELYEEEAKLFSRPRK